MEIQSIEGERDIVVLTAGIRRHPMNGTEINHASRISLLSPPRPLSIKFFLSKRELLMISSATSSTPKSSAEQRRRAEVSHLGAGHQCTPRKWGLQKTNNIHSKQHYNKTHSSRGYIHTQKLRAPRPLPTKPSSTAYFSPRLPPLPNA